MPILDLADERVPLPLQLVVDTSLLLACREGDDNPFSQAAQKFIRRLGERIAEYQMVVWLLCPVLQACYHIILRFLARMIRTGLRRTRGRGESRAEDRRQMTEDGNKRLRRTAGRLDEQEQEGRMDD